MRHHIGMGCSPRCQNRWLESLDKKTLIIVTSIPQAKPFFSIFISLAARPTPEPEPIEAGTCECESNGKLGNCDSLDIEEIDVFNCGAKWFTNNGWIVRCFWIWDFPSWINFKCSSREMVNFHIDTKVFLRCRITGPSLKTDILLYILRLLFWDQIVFQHCSSKGGSIVSNVVPCVSFGSWIGLPTKSLRIIYL